MSNVGGLALGQKFELSLRDGRLQVAEKPEAIDRQRKCGGTPLQHIRRVCRQASSRVSTKSTGGYATLAVVTVLAILSTLATRTLVIATLDSVRATGYGQGLTATLYAAEISLANALTAIASGADPATTTDWTCVSTSVNTSVQSGDGSFTRNYTTDYRLLYMGELSSRHLYRVYARALVAPDTSTVSSAPFESTVSQIVSVDLSVTPKTVYVIPGTWTDTLAASASSQSC